MQILKLIRPTTGVLVLPLLHLLLCIVVQLNASEGGWWWFPMYLVDLPFSALLVHVPFLPGLVVFGVFGTLWWYFIGVIIRFVLTWHPPMSD